MNEVVGEDVVIAGPVVLDSRRYTVLKVAERAVETLLRIGIAGLLVPINVVVEIGTKADTQIPALVLDACAEASTERSIRALIGIAILIGYLSITVAVNIYAFERETIGVINLLIDVE